MALIIRGPNQFRRHAYDELNQTYLRRGIYDAFEPLAELLAQRQDDMFTTHWGPLENFLDCHAYIVGWSPSAKSVTAWRFLSSPTFEPEQLPPGLHAAPEPGCDAYFTSMFLVENLVEVVKIQEQGAVEQDGRQTISGYLIHIVMTRQEITMRKVLRFPQLRSNGRGDGKMKELQELRRHLEVGLKHAPSVPMMQRLKVYRKLAEAAIELAVMCERLIEDVVLPNRSEAISKDKEPLI